MSLIGILCEEPKSGLSADALNLVLDLDFEPDPPLFPPLLDLFLSGEFYLKVRANCDLGCG